MRSGGEEGGCEKRYEGVLEGWSVEVMAEGVWMGVM